MEYPEVGLFFDNINEEMRLKDKYPFYFRIDGILIDPRKNELIIDMNGWMERLDSSILFAILKKLGYDYNMGWSSWENENWTIEDEYIKFKITVGTSTPNPITYSKDIKIETFKKVVFQLFCPYYFNSLKSCNICIFYLSDRCVHENRWIKPYIDIEKNLDLFIKTESYFEYEYGTTFSEVYFRILHPQKGKPNKLERLKLGLKSHMTCQKDEDKLTFIKYWESSSTKHHIIILDTKTNIGYIKASETLEVWNEEGKIQVLSLKHSKRHKVMKALIEVCDWTRGSIEVIPLKEIKEIEENW